MNEAALHATPQWTLSIIVPCFNEEENVGLLIEAVFKTMSADPRFIELILIDDGSLDLEAFDRLLDERVKLVGCIHIANSLGTINPVKALAAKAHRVGAKFLLDAAQSAPHMPLDVVDLEASQTDLSFERASIARSSSGRMADAGLSGVLSTTALVLAVNAWVSWASLKRQCGGSSRTKRGTAPARSAMGR